MATYFELVTSDKAKTDSQARQLVWSSQGDTATVRASVDPWLVGLGEVSAPVIDLVRIAVAALIADRRSSRPSGWTRDLRLRVHVVDVSKWSDAVSTISTLLQFLSGDIWDIELVADVGSKPDKGDSDAAAVEYRSTALFSGGLDSFCSALIARSSDESQGYVSQRDNPTVGGSQNRAADWLVGNVDEAFEPLTITLAQAEQIIDSTSRTRSLLFLALGIAAAEATSAPQLVVPENGFTSLNPPLRADRTGPLSTRSTHPYSFALLQLILEQLGVIVAVANPYSWLTKGELVTKAVEANAAAPGGFAVTLSCAKLDGRLYKGGNQNWNCGLCVACIIRRAAIAAAGVPDETPYVATKVKKAALRELTDRRHSDIQAVRRALAVGVDEDDLLSSAEFPVHFDIDQALELWERALKEIKLVPLP